MSWASGDIEDWLDRKGAVNTLCGRTRGTVIGMHGQDCETCNGLAKELVAEALREERCAQPVGNSHRGRVIHTPDSATSTQTVRSTASP